MINRFRHLLSLSVLGVLSTSCSVYQSPLEITYYTLSEPADLSSRSVENWSVDKALIRVQRVTSTTFLSQPSIITENQNHTITAANYHHWAELPEIAIKRTLDRCITLRSKDLQSSKKMNVVINIHRFNRDHIGHAINSGYWRAYDTETTTTQAENHFDYMEPQLVDGYHGVVSALSITLDKLCSDIVDTLAKS